MNEMQKKALEELTDAHKHLREADKKVVDARTTLKDAELRSVHERVKIINRMVTIVRDHEELF